MNLRLHIFTALLAAALSGTVFAPTILAADSPSVQRVQDAREQLRAAQQRVDRLVDRAKQKLAADPEWVRLQTAVDDATRQLDATRDRVLEKTKAQPDYVAAQEQLTRATADLQQAQTSADWSPNAIDRAHSQILDARLKMKFLEQNAVSKSPEMIAAQTRLTDASALLDRKWNDYVGMVLSGSPSWQNANRTLLKAQSELEAAEAVLAQERRAQPAGNRPARGPSSYNR